MRQPNEHADSPDIIPMTIPVPPSTELKMSAYDRASTWLIAFVLMCGVVTGSLFLMWLGKTLRYERPMYALTFQEEGYGRGDNPAGFARDSKAPGDPELPPMDEPAGTELHELTEPSPTAAIAFIADAAAVAVAEVGDVVFDPTATTGRVAGYPGGTGGGEGGLGDSRPPGPAGEGINVIPRWERWELRFSSTNVQAYARQLDSFGIELGAIGGKPLVDYAFNLAKPTPDRKSGPSKAEKRLYMTWSGGTLKQFDRQLLQRAGIEVSGRLLVQFYP